MKQETNSTSAILDIHAHKWEVGSEGKSIINYRILSDTPFQEGRYYSIGIHPWELTAANYDLLLDFMLDRLPSRQVVAIGEAGLDRLVETSMAIQQLAFVMQVQLSETYGLPLIIHCVKAADQLLAVKKQLKPRQPWIWHGFRGKPEQAAQLLKHGFYLSLGERYPDETMKLIPDDRLFLETDESSLTIEDILQRAAGVRGVGVEVLRDTVRGNIQNVFFKS